MDNIDWINILDDYLNDGRFLYKDSKERLEYFELIKSFIIFEPDLPEDVYILFSSNAKFKELVDIFDLELDL